MTANPGMRLDSGRSSGLMYLICMRSSHTGISIGTPGALFGWSCRDDEADMAAPVFDLYCSGTIAIVEVNVPDPPVLMSRIDLRGQHLSTAGLRSVLPRGGVDVDAVVPTVRPIVDAVAHRGAEAALEYGERFDGVRP